MHTDDGAGALRTTAAGSSALVTAVLPVFLVGAASDAIQADLGFGEAATGAAATVLLLVSGLSAATMGRLTERLGAGIALRLGVAIAGTCTAAAGLLANSWWQLALPLAVVGLAVGLIDTGAARAFADRVPATRQGTAFGIKEASVPAASLLAGLALPTVAVEFGWRAMFVAALGVAAVVWLLLPDPAATGPRDHDLPVAGTAVTSPGIVRFVVGIGFGTAAATAAATFLVPSVADRGLSTAVAGTVLAVASVGSIVARVLMGRWADRSSTVPTRAVGIMLLIGAAGAGLLATSMPTSVVVLGAILVLAAGWGWTGLAFVAVVRARPEAPAAAAGLVLSGLGLGGALGPAAFGTLVERMSYAAAWTGTGLALAVAAVVTLSTTRALAPPPAR